jgi:hypothetical protein
MMNRPEMQTNRRDAADTIDGAKRRVTVVYRSIKLRLDADFPALIDRNGNVIAGHGWMSQNVAGGER